MNYQDFLNAVVDCVKKIVGKEAEVFIHRVTKNNGIVLDGIEKGQQFFAYNIS